MGIEPPQEPGLIETPAAGIAHEVRNPLNSLFSGRAAEAHRS